MYVINSWGDTGSTGEGSNPGEVRRIAANPHKTEVEGWRSSR